MPADDHTVDAPLVRIDLEPTDATGVAQPSQIMVDKVTTIPRINVRDRIGHLSTPIPFGLTAHSSCSWASPIELAFSCREGVLVSRTKAINELRSLIVAAPDKLRAQLRGRLLAV